MIPLWSQIITLILAGALLSLLVAAGPDGRNEIGRAPESAVFGRAYCGARKCFSSLRAVGLGAGTRQIGWPEGRRRCHIAIDPAPRVSGAVGGSQVAVSHHLRPRLPRFARCWRDWIWDHSCCGGDQLARAQRTKLKNVLNYRAALDAGRAICFHIWRQRPGASERVS